ncbi:MAG TPA: glycosyltransferase, partial [Dehalococcoidia bacterium]|nr:glycosyltransferase [Dehalococcoidia bacterium]
MSKNISQTVIIPTRNEENYIEACINSLIDDWVISTTEFLIVDGRSTDRTLEIVKEKFAHLNLKILDNPNLYQSYAMNIGIKNSSSVDTHPFFHNEGEEPNDWAGIIIRADAHCIFPQNYIRDLRQTIRKESGGIEGVGVLNVGSIQNSVGTDTFTKAVATVMNSKYAMGGVKY